MRVGECVMVLMPSEVQGKDWKLATPFHDPYYVIQVTPTNAEVRLIDQRRGESIFVALDCVRWCYPHQGDENMDRIKEKEKASLKQCTYSEPVLHRSHIKDQSLIQGAQNWITLDLLERLNSRMNY